MKTIGVVGVNQGMSWRCAIEMLSEKKWLHNS
jgi:hypothetical protein